MATRQFTRFPLPKPDAGPYVVRVDDATRRIWIGTSASDAVYAYDAPPGRIPAKIARLQLGSNTGAR